MKTMQHPDVKKGMTFQATEIVIRGPAEFRKLVQASMVENEKLVNPSGWPPTDSSPGKIRES